MLFGTRNELVNWRRSPAGAQGTNSGHKNAEGMAAVGVHVERIVRLANAGEGVKTERLLHEWFRAYCRPAESLAVISARSDSSQNCFLSSNAWLAGSLTSALLRSLTAISSASADIVSSVPRNCEVLSVNIAQRRKARSAVARPFIAVTSFSNSSNVTMSPIWW